MKKQVVLVFAIATMLVCSNALLGQDKPSIIKHEIFPHWYYFDKEDGTPALTMKEFGSYYDALFASVFAAEDIFGRCSDERIAVISAWRSVGVTSNSIPLCARSQQEKDKISAEITEVLPVIQKGNDWHTFFYEIDGYHNYEFFCTDDTLIGNVRYVKLMNSKDSGKPYLFGVFREEDGKIWGQFLGVSDDILVYDFTANVGETLIFGYMDHSFTVDSISMENIGGIDRKKLWFGLNYDNFGNPHAIETWIEGIGSDLGLPWTGFGGGYDFSSRLLCFHQNGELVWQDPAYNACSPAEVEVINTEDGLIVYPNPVIDKMVIEGVKAAEVRIYNAFGQLVKTEKSTNEIHTTGLAEGIYLLRITDVEGRTHGISVVKN